MKKTEQRSILLVDDLYDQVENVKGFMEGEGWRCKWVESGEECLEVLNGDPTWDIILLDAQLKSGHLHGRDTLKEILRLHPEKCVVFLTGVELEAYHAVIALQGGAIDYIPKPPLDMPKFIERLERAIRVNRERLENQRNREADKVLTVTRAVNHQVLPRIQAAYLWASKLTDETSWLASKDRLSQVRANLEQAERYLRRSVYFNAESYHQDEAETRLLEAVNKGIQSVRGLRQLRWGGDDPVTIEEPSGGAGVLVQLQEMPVEMITEILVSNAAEAVHLLEDNAQERRVTVSFVDESKNVLLVVDDTGPGISADVRERLFEAGFTTKRGWGTGYGLFLVKSIVGAENVWFENKEGPGARAVVRFPKANV